MFHRMFRCKLHRMTITQAELHYRGSITIDETLLKKIGMMPNEEVDIWNVTRGSRIRTYVIPGPPDSGVICINGAAAHLNNKNDMVIIAAYAYMSAEEIAKGYTAKVIVGEDDPAKGLNKIQQYNEVYFKAGFAEQGNYSDYEWQVLENAGGY